MTDDQARRDEVAEVLWQPMTEHVLRYMGYSGDEIERYTAPPNHEAHGCEFDANSLAWDCYDEHGTSRHPDHDEAGSVAEIVRVALEVPALARIEREAKAEVVARVEEFCADWERSADEDERYLNRAHASEIHDVYASIRMNREHVTSLRAALDEPTGEALHSICRKDQP